ncbi:MAG: triose-phosphate isomerase [Bdellovibrionales bacterium]|jgi:triosephosphate isomerase|nr:triose-phosphate isomerase [Bdellovibrionales bacterium]
MRDFILAANWKMHKSPREAVQFFRDFVPALESKLKLAPLAESGGAPRVARGFGQGPNKGARRVLFFVPALNVFASEQAVRGSGLELGIQNIHSEAKGAFTGENSPVVASEMGVSWALVGHSERRALFSETDAQTGLKMQAALVHGLSAMICVGETLAEREAGITMTVVERQLDAALTGIAETLRATPDRVAVAYEPVWAIGTGKVATPEQASSVHQSIRQWLVGKFGAETAGLISILYGGSVKSDNAAAIAAQPEIDGFLVGGASLEPQSFLGLI